MINILKHGRPELMSDPFKTFDCPACRCIFKADNADYQVFTQYNETTYAAKCPECGKASHERAMRSSS